MCSFLVMLVVVKILKHWCHSEVCFFFSMKTIRWLQPGAHRNRTRHKRESMLKQLEYFFKWSQINKLKHL